MDYDTINKLKIGNKEKSPIEWKIIIRLLIIYFVVALIMFFTKEIIDWRGAVSGEIGVNSLYVLASLILSWVLMLGSILYLILATFYLKIKTNIISVFLFILFFSSLFVVLFQISRVIECQLPSSSISYKCNPNQIIRFKK